MLANLIFVAWDQPRVSHYRSILMNIELHSAEFVSTEEQPQYVFITDSDLVEVGGGSALVDY